MEKAVNARELALKALHRVDQEAGFSNLVLEDTLRKEKISDLDKSLITEIVYGVTSRRLTLDYIISIHSKIKINKISPWIINILRMGLYQMLYLTKIPVSAACNESVKLARRYGHQASAGFVNAILRNMKKQDEVLAQVGGMNTVSKLSILHSHPEWIVKIWIEQYGEKFTEELCKANNERPHIAVRVNTLKIDYTSLKKMLEDRGIKTEKSKISEDALIIDHGNPINELFEQGYYTVQDEAAMLVTEILKPESGDIVADLCSAPGGKTTHIAQLMHNKGKIIAWDIHEHRVELVKKTAQRLGVDIIETRYGDATKEDENLIEKCDKVLIDAPCSGLGVIRRKPEIKWTRKSEHIEELINIQRALLNAGSKYVKPGGRLVYSTCTLNSSENEDIIKSFIEMNQKFELEYEHIKSYSIEGNVEGKGYVYLFPNIQKTDGFFIAALKKKI